MAGGEAVTTNASPSTLDEWRRRRKEIAVALYRETIEDRDAAELLAASRRRRRPAGLPPRGAASSKRSSGSR